MLARSDSVLWIWYLITVLTMVVMVWKDWIPWDRAIEFLHDILMAMLNIGESQLIYFLNVLCIKGG